MSVALPGLDLTHSRAARAFEAAYWHRFDVELPEIRPVLVNLHTAVIGKRKPVDLGAHRGGRAARRPAEAQAGRARASGSTGGWAETPVYRRERLPPGAMFDGPAIVEQLDCHHRDRAGQPRPARRASAISSYASEAGAAERDDVKTRIDPVTLAVMQNGLQQVCNEMDLAFVRAALSAR